jgi:7,8-dihydroneopterin aldolase/epimerase/oxygenase
MHGLLYFPRPTEIEAADIGVTFVTQDRIRLQGMVFHGRHGTVPAERELGQQFVVDVDLHCELQAAGLSDDLAKTVDYSQVYRQVRAIVEGPPVALTETVAERIAAVILQHHTKVEAVRVCVAKPQVRLEGGVLAGSAIEIVRHRDA